MHNFQETFLKCRTFIIIILEFSRQENNTENICQIYDNDFVIGETRSFHLESKVPRAVS